MSENTENVINLERVLELASQLSDAEQAQLVSEIMAGIAERIEEQSPVSTSDE